MIRLCGAPHNRIKPRRGVSDEGGRECGAGEGDGTTVPTRGIYEGAVESSQVG